MFSLENTWECDDGQSKLNANLFGIDLQNCKKEHQFIPQDSDVSTEKSNRQKNCKRKQTDLNDKSLCETKIDNKRKRKKNQSNIYKSNKEETFESKENNYPTLISTNTNAIRSKEAGIQKKVKKKEKNKKSSKLKNNIKNENDVESHTPVPSIKLDDNVTDRKECLTDFSTITKKKQKKIKNNNFMNLEQKEGRISKNHNDNSIESKMVKIESADLARKNFIDKNPIKIKEQINSVNTLKNTSKYNKFQAKLNRKLDGGHFRWINEQLYTNHSSNAQKLFRSNYQLFELYHKGFSTQIKHWPQNPVDLMIKYVLDRDKDLVVCDFGCGEAKIAASVPNVVHSFDLVAVNDRVTACDMKKVPLQNETSDIAIFCLSLMGTNLEDFIVEAHRILKPGGVLKIAEVKSRFENIDLFIENICTVGFSLKLKDDSNKMFVMIDFEKTSLRPTKNIVIKLNPCIYKRR